MCKVPGHARPQKTQNFSRPEQGEMPSGGFRGVGLGFLSHSRPYGLKKAHEGVAMFEQLFLEPGGRNLESVAAGMAEDE